MTQSTRRAVRKKKAKKRKQKKKCVGPSFFFFLPSSTLRQWCPFPKLGGFSIGLYLQPRWGIRIRCRWGRQPTADSPCFGEYEVHAGGHHPIRPSTTPSATVCFSSARSVGVAAEVKRGEGCAVDLVAVCRSRRGGGGDCMRVELEAAAADQGTAPSGVLLRGVCHGLQRRSVPLVGQ